MESTVHAAAPDRAAARGWHVFPCRPRDKRPAVDRWEERASADPERVARYWPGPQHNAGIACGPSGLVAVDLDAHGELPEDWRLPGVLDGRDVLACLCEWARQDWPDTYMVKTPTGGLHMYFTAPAEPAVRNSQNKLGPAIDVRAAGGFVLAAGSVLDERAYPGRPDLAALVRGGRPYELLHDVPPVPLPGWLARLAAPRPDPVPARPVVHGDRLGALVNTVLAGQPGDRNGLLYWAACRAGEMVATGEADAQAASDALVDAAVRSGLRGGEAEARRTVGSGLRRGAGQ